MALTLSAEGGVVTVDEGEDGGFTLDVSGSSVKLSAEHAALLADYLTEGEGEEVEAELEEEVEGEPEPDA